MKEVWKDIHDFEGLYQVSNHGRVRRLFKNGKENILKGKKYKDGYIIVILSKNQQKKFRRLHRLVAEAFIPNPENKPEVNHKDRNKQNNFVNLIDMYGESTNLEWATASENAIHCVNTGRKNKTRAIAQYNKDMELIKNWQSIADASRELKIASPNIVACCNLRMNTAGGYIWRYKEGSDVTV